MPQLDRATCHDVVRMLDDYLGRELRPEEIERIRRHLELCAACADEVRFEERVLRSLRAKLRRIALPAGLEARVWKAIAHARRAGAEPR